MKKSTTIFLLFFSLSAFADQPISATELHSNLQTVWTKPTFLQFDDTGAIQSALNSHAGGTYTMPVFGTYHISSTLTVPANTVWDINGNNVITSQTTGQAVVINAGSTVENGTIEGPWDYTTAPNPTSGGVGIKIAGSNVTITNCTISEFSSSGIIEKGNYSNTVITHNSITKTGYIGFYYNPELNGTHDLIFSYNIIDRSMIYASTIQEACVEIRASVNVATDTVSNVTFTHNSITMPLNPTNGAAECFELRRAKNSRVDSNSFTGGTIGASIVVANNVGLTRNHIYNQRDEAIEMLGNNHCTTHNNYISGVFTQGGILIDMTNPTTNTSHFDTCYYDTIKTTGNYGVHTTAGTSNIVFNGLVIHTHQNGFYFAQTSNISIINTNINGGGLTNTQGIYFNTGPGNLTYTNGSIDSCSRMMYGYSTALNHVTDSITFTGVGNISTPTQKSQYFTNGSHWGAHLAFIVNTLTFPAIASRAYGNADFSPGVASTLAITYTTTGHNTSIVSANIHIIGVGTDTITATTADTAISRPVVITKAVLNIFADSFLRPYNSANPTLTATYTGFVYGETHTVLTTQPTLSTAAVTLSAPGSYTITNSGATAANYTITNHNGTLIIAPVSVGIVIHHIYKVLNH